MPKYSEQNKFSSWIFSIAHNVTIDYHRKKSARNIFINDEEIDNYNYASNPHAELVAVETGEIISRQVESLSFKQKEVFLLRQNGGMTFREISELTGEPLNTVLSHMNYAVKKIKKALRKANAI